MKSFFEKWLLLPVLIISFFVPAILLTGGTGSEILEVSAAAFAAGILNNII